MKSSHLSMGYVNLLATQISPIFFFNNYISYYSQLNHFSSYYYLRPVHHQNCHCGCVICPFIANSRDRFTSTDGILYRVANPSQQQKFCTLEGYFSHCPWTSRHICWFIFRRYATYSVLLNTQKRHILVILEKFIYYIYDIILYLILIINNFSLIIFQFRDNSIPRRS